MTNLHTVEFRHKHYKQRCTPQNGIGTENDRKLESMI